MKDKQEHVLALSTRQVAYVLRLMVNDVYDRQEQLGRGPKDGLHRELISELITVLAKR